MIIAEEECSVTLRWAVKSACLRQTSRNKCSVYYGGHLYNLKPLSHSLDSWRIETKSHDSTFWLNVCQGILNNPDQNCPKSAAICMRDNQNNMTNVLAYTDQMHMKIKNDAYSIEVVYNNTRRPCIVNSKHVQDYTITYIEYKCGQTIGRPKLLDNNDKAIREMPIFMTDGANECIYAFEWKSRIACKNSTQVDSRVVVKQGIMYDEKHSGVEIDMSEIFENSVAYLDNDDNRKSTGHSYKYFIQFKGRFCLI